MKKLLYILLFVPLALFGQDNYSLNFQTVDAGVNLGNSNFFQINESDTMTKTIMFWAKDDWIDDTRRNFMTKGACASSSCMDIHFWYNVSDSEIVFATGNSEDACSHGIISHLLSDKWNFFSITIKANSNSSGEKKLYLNGELLFSCNYLYNALSNDEDLYVGFSSSTNANQIKPIKYVDNLSIWDRVLTEEEINYFMRNNVVGDEVNLLGGWDFNEGIGNIATDISGNGNNGDIFGGVIYSIDYPKLGCVDSIALNYNPEADINDGSCISQEEYTIDSLNSVILDATTSLSSLQQALDTWNTTIDLSAGWNMFGYGCPISIDLAEGLSNHTESISITKDNNGNVYMPEFSFNGIGDLTPGFGYQIKLTEAIEGFSLCDWYVNDIPEDNIVSLQDSLELINSQIGCADSLACNFDITKLYDDGSCEYAEEGYDCESNITYPFIGMEAYGGIIFYIDESGQHGLVAALEDLEGTYEWGCWSEYIDGAQGTEIGTGYQNTLDIIDANCVLGGYVNSFYTGVNAAQASINYQYDGYSDWYLPSKDELDAIYTNIGPLSGNIGGFYYDSYWGSTQRIHDSGGTIDGWRFWMNNEADGNNGSWDGSCCRCFPQKVRPIRSF